METWPLPSLSPYSEFLSPGSWLADLIDLFPARHPKHRAHQKILGAAIIVSLVFVPTAFTKGVNWLADRMTAEVQDVVDGMLERQEQRRREREPPTAATTISN